MVAIAFDSKCKTLCRNKRNKAGASVLQRNRRTISDKCASGTQNMFTFILTARQLELSNSEYYCKTRRQRRPTAGALKHGVLLQNMATATAHSWSSETRSTTATDYLSSSCISVENYKTWRQRESFRSVSTFALLEAITYVLGPADEYLNRI
jgi:hypothetical protein